MRAPHCPRCHRESGDPLAEFCNACGAPLRFAEEPPPTPLSAPIAIDRRAEDGSDLELTGAGVPPPLRPEPRAPAAAPLTPSPHDELADVEKSVWDLGPLLAGAPEPSLSSAQVPAAGPARRPAPPLGPPAPARPVPAPPRGAGAPPRAPLPASTAPSPTSAAPAAIPPAAAPAHPEPAPHPAAAVAHPVAPAPPRPEPAPPRPPHPAAAAAHPIAPAAALAHPEPAPHPAAAATRPFAPAPSHAAPAPPRPAPATPAAPARAVAPAMPAAHGRDAGPGDVVEVHVRRAEPWRRAAAWAVDAIPFVAGGVALSRQFVRQAAARAAATSGLDLLDFVARERVIVLSVAAAMAVALGVYATLAHALAGATLGKRLLRLRVVGPDGERPALARSAARSALAVVSAAALGLGFLLALFTPRGRALHDLLARTWVVDARP